MNDTSEHARPLLTTPGEIIRALLRFRDCYDPRTGSLMLVGSGQKDPHGEPFRPGFISGFEERAELQERLSRLEPRERLLLILWYIEGQPVTHIARSLGVSRVHCYRLKRKAFHALLDDDGSDAETVAPAVAMGVA